MSICTSEFNYLRISRIIISKEEIQMEEVTDMIIQEIRKLSPERIRRVQEAISSNKILHNTLVAKYINQIIYNVVRNKK